MEGKAQAWMTMTGTNFKDKPVEEKAQAWMTRTGKARSTYFDHKRLLLTRLVADDADVDLLGRLSLGK